MRRFWDLLDRRRDDLCDDAPVESVTSTNRGAIREGLTRLELRTVFAPVVGRFAAERAEPRHVFALRELVQQMRDAEDDTAALARIALEFWAEVVSATNNLGFTLAFDSLAVSYGSVLEHLHHLLAAELRAVDEYDLLVDAIAAQKGYAAAERAAGIVAHGASAIERVVAALDAAQGEGARAQRKPIV